MNQIAIFYFPLAKEKNVNKDLKYNFYLSKVISIMVYITFDNIILII